MELLQGESLSDIRHRQADQRLPLKICIAFVRQIVTLLEQLHDMGIVHRDVKPRSDECYIISFYITLVVLTPTVGLDGWGRQ